jgi:hypothetical protein
MKLACNGVMGADGVETSPEPARPLNQPPTGSLANYKNRNRELGLLHLEWAKRPDGSWWLFADVDARQLGADGVFVVWQNGDRENASSVLYVGRGSLRDEFARCHRDPIFRPEGLHVTWATVDIRMLDSVCAYLYRTLRPMWGEAVFASSTPVNLPLTV